MLMSSEESRWVYKMQVLAGARHADVKEREFFLDLLRAADCHVRRDAAVRDVEHEHDLPLLPLRRVAGRKHEVVLIEMRRTRLGAGGLRRVQGQLGEEGAARRISPGYLLQLIEIGPARSSMVRADARDEVY